MLTSEKNYRYAIEKTLSNPAVTFPSLPTACDLGMTMNATAPQYETKR